jgi:hypothetical protein
MQLRPTHHADDMGARFAEPSSLVELTSTTGVPKYRMAGSMTECMAQGRGSGWPGSVNVEVRAGRPLPGSCDRIARPRGIRAQAADGPRRVPVRRFPACEP